MLNTQTRFVISVLIIALYACTSPTPSAGNSIPQTEAEVPRVSVTDAKAAFDSGKAIIVDVRSADAHAASHIPGAINIQLGDIELNPADLNLANDQWIITYCT